MAKSPISESRYYIYEIVVDRTVRYVGKGTGYRLKFHLRRANDINCRRIAGEKVRALKVHNRLAKALRGGANIESFKVIEGLTSTQAFAAEVDRIASYPADQLWNMTAGGDGLDSKSAKEIWANPQYRKKMLAVRKSDKFKSRLREVAISQRNDPSYCEKVRAGQKKRWEGDPEYRDRQIKRLQAQWSDPELRKRHKAAVAMRWKDPAQIENRREITRQYAATVEFKAKKRADMNKLWATEDGRAKCTAHWRDPERKKKIIASWTPEFLKRRGEAISNGLKAKFARERELRLNAEASPSCPVHPGKS